MKYTFYFLVMVLCLNVSILILEDFGLNSVATTTFDESKISGDYNITALIDSQDLEQQDFYHIGKGALLFFKYTRTLFLGTYDFMIALGVPTLLATLVQGIISFLDINFLICFITGRDYLP